MLINSGAICLRLDFRSWPIFSVSITALVGFNEGRANVSIAMFGNPEAVVFAAGGVFPDIHADPGHQFSRMRKSFDVTNLCNYRQCKDILDALVTGQ